ncbi:MAG: AzlD domain-containing protein [Pseudomonadota bacterium]
MSAEPELWGLGPYLAILLLAALPTHIWRWLGVLFAGRLDDQSEVFVWVKSVATAIVAALIAKLVLLPTGPLADIPAAARVAAALLGFAAYALSKRLVVGIVVAEGLLVVAWFTLR